MRATNRSYFYLSNQWRTLFDPMQPGTFRNVLSVGCFVGLETYDQNCHRRLPIQYMHLYDGKKLNRVKSHRFSDAY